MSDFPYAAVVSITLDDDGGTKVALTSNYPVSVSIYERASEPGGERVTHAEFQAPNVHETRYIKGGDDGEGDELDFGEGVEPDADDDLPLAAEGGIHVVPH